MKLNTTKINGFTLPTVLILSLTIMTMMVVLLTATTSSYDGATIDYYQKLSDEAAEAGTASATSCLSLSDHTQTWGSAAGGRPNLTPNTDCNGANTYPSNTYIHSDSKVRTYYNVGNLDYAYSFSTQISSFGYAEVLSSSGSVVKTYTTVRKKVITWPTNTIGQSSAAGSFRTCAVVSYSVYCWGRNAYGQLGDGRYLGTGSIDANSSIDSNIPVKVLKQDGVLAGKKVVKIFAAQYHSCALTEDGLMYCWGYNANGQLGTNNTTDSAVPIQVGGALSGKVITDIGGTYNNSCAIAEGKIYCWGYNLSGLTGLGVSTGDTLTPTLVTASNTATTLPTAYTATELSTSGTLSRTLCAISSGKAYCWGQNASGAVGDGSTTQRTVPTKVIDTGVLSGKIVTSITSEGYAVAAPNGFAHVCAVASGLVYCWGENQMGQLGDGTTVDKSVPTAVDWSGVLSGKTATDVQAGLQHTCILAGGGVYCWGYNNFGQVGDNTTIDKLTPVTVTQQTGGLTATNVTAIGGGANRSCAVTTTGRTYCWGLNSSGQIGDGTSINRTVPTESLFLRSTANQYIF